MKKNVAKTTGISHPDEFRAEALRLADQLSAAAARQLDLHISGGLRPKIGPLGALSSIHPETA